MKSNCTKIPVHLWACVLAHLVTVTRSNALQCRGVYLGVRKHGDADPCAASSCSASNHTFYTTHASHHAPRGTQCIFSSVGGIPAGCIPGEQCAEPAAPLEKSAALYPTLTPAAAVCPHYSGTFHETRRRVPDGQVMAVQSTDATHFTVKSQNSSFEDTTCSLSPLYPVSSSSCQIDCTFSSFGTLQGIAFPGEIVWTDQRFPSGRLYWVKGTLPPALLTCNFTDAIYHDVPYGATVPQGEYKLNSVDGRRFTIHSLNESFKDTTAVITRTAYVQNMSAYFTNLGKTLHGIMQEARPGDGCILYWSVAAGLPAHAWAPGPLPPPPPPPPLMCPDQYTQTTCDAVTHADSSSKRCAWCQSDDGVHALCFDLANVPALNRNEWKCNRRVIAYNY